MSRTNPCWRCGQPELISVLAIHGMCAGCHHRKEECRYNCPCHLGKAEWYKGPANCSECAPYHIMSHEIVYDAETLVVTCRSCEEQLQSTEMPMKMPSDLFMHIAAHECTFTIENPGAWESKRAPELVGGQS